MAAIWSLVSCERALWRSSGLIRDAAATDELHDEQLGLEHDRKRPVGNRPPRRWDAVCAEGPGKGRGPHERWGPRMAQERSGTYEGEGEMRVRSSWRRSRRVSLRPVWSRS